MSRYTWISAKLAGNVADMIYVLYSTVLSFNQNLEKQSRSLTITSKIEALIRLSLILTTHFDFDFSTVQPSFFWTPSFKSDLTFRPKGRGPKSRKLGTCSLVPPRSKLHKEHQIRSSRRSKFKPMPSYYSEVLATREELDTTWCACSTYNSSCVFYGDLFPNKEHFTESVARNITLLIEARQKFAYGSLKEYFFW